MYYSSIGANTLTNKVYITFSTTTVWPLGNKLKRFIPFINFGISYNVKNWSNYLDLFVRYYNYVVHYLLYNVIQSILHYGVISGSCERAFSYVHTHKYTSKVG